MKDLITDAKTTFGDEYDEEHARPLKVIFSTKKSQKERKYIGMGIQDHRAKQQH